MKKNLKKICKVQSTVNNSFDFYSHDIWGQDFNLSKLVDNGTIYAIVQHVYARGFFDKRPISQCEDVCLKMFGKQNDECIKHNASR